MKNKSSVILFLGLIVIATGCSRWEGSKQMHAKTFRVVDPLTTVDLRDVTVQGEIGRRIDLTINKNLLALDVDNDFIKPFQEKKSEGTWEYIALGKLIDATVHFATYTNDERVLALKRHLIDSAIASQDADGYIGLFKPGKRLTNLWDIH